MLGVLEPSAESYIANDFQASNTHHPRPIVFISPGSRPDVRFKVFKDEYHQHSAILRYHSNFFRQFLDSPDKRAGPASSSFCYEYLSISQQPDTPPGFDFITESSALGKYRCALYTRPYTITSQQELIVVTRMADYYCTLPILSATLTGALFNSPMFEDPRLNPEQNFCEISGQLLFTARTIRHLELFRECFTHVIGMWNDKALSSHDRELLEADSQLLTLIYKVRGELSSVVLQLQKDLLNVYVHEEMAWFGMDDLLRPLLLEELYNCNAWTNLYYSHRDLLASNLGFDKSGCRAGEGIYEKQFLCTQISDEDMPWDSDEIDW
ncbi:hypothetical protein DL98DRAFT_653535 [Cadophora sp. DSE1049]|nr:hypothetical protein DL98DRAFT_653535 [Cadophora sp. DSE1049]